MKGQYFEVRRSALIFTLSAPVLTAFLSTVLPASLAGQTPKTPAVSSPASGKEKKDRVTISTELVSLNVAITDKQGHNITGLDRNAFAVYEDDVRQEISFFSNCDAPASIGIVFDNSGSMSGEKMVRAGDAIKRFIQTGHSEDEYSLISFNDQARLLLDRARDGEALLDGFSTIRPGGNTALYDGVALGIEALAQGRYPKRALLVISDGEDNRSRHTLNQITRKLHESGITIYSILIGMPLPRTSGPAIMDQLATASGGKFFFPNNGEAMNEDFAEIALELRHQYSVGYIPTNHVRDTRWHRIKVMVAPPAGSPHLVVRSRKGYYAVTGRNGYDSAVEGVVPE